MYLCIDTSGAYSSVALVQSENSLSPKLISQRQEESQTHSSSLDALLRLSLQELSIAVSDLKGIVIGAGPGSFTGLRIGFAFSKGLAMSLGVGLAKISSLRAAAFAVKDKSELILSIDKAGKEEFYAATFNAKNSLSVEQAEQIVTADWINNWALSNPDGIIVSHNKLEFDRLHKINFLASNVGLCFFSQEKLQFVGNAADLADFSPNYMRRVAALSIAERQAKGMI